MHGTSLSILQLAKNASRGSNAAQGVNTCLQGFLWDGQAGSQHPLLNSVMLLYHREPVQAPIKALSISAMEDYQAKRILVIKHPE